MPEAGEFTSGLDLDWFVDTDLSNILQQFVEDRGLEWDVWRDDYLPYFAEYDTTEEEMLYEQYSLETDMANIEVLGDLDEVNVNEGVGSFVGNYASIDADKRINRLHQWESIERQLEMEIKEYQLKKSWESELFDQIISMADADIFIDPDDEGDT